MRLFRSLKYVRIDPGLSKDDMLDILREAVERNEHVRHEVGDFNLWPQVTMGPSLDGPGGGETSDVGFRWTRSRRMACFIALDMTR